MDDEQLETYYVNRIAALSIADAEPFDLTEFQDLFRQWATLDRLATMLWFDVLAYAMTRPALKAVLAEKLDPDEADLEDTAYCVITHRGQVLELFNDIIHRLEAMQASTDGLRLRLAVDNTKSESDTNKPTMKELRK